MRGKIVMALCIITLYLPSSMQGKSKFPRTLAEHDDHNVSPVVPLLGDIMLPCFGQLLLPFPFLLPSWDIPLNIIIIYLYKITNPNIHR